MQKAIPDAARVVDAFWENEMRFGYDKALKMTAEEYGISEDDVETAVTEDDAANNGNG